MDAMVFVMGEVNAPGAYSIQTFNFSVMDALNLAGSPTEDADIKKIRLIRGMTEKSDILNVNLSRIVSKGDPSDNYKLKKNDILYVPRKGIAKFNYYLRQINSFISTFINATVVEEALKTP